MINAPLPDPPDLGFPAKFAKWYPDQVRAIDRVLTNPCRVTALNMPTGSGKSVTGVAAALLHPNVTRAIYLTSTKGLQDQLAADFADLGLLDVRGKRNYPCKAIEPGGELAHFFPQDDLRIAVKRARQRFLTCEDGPCHAGVTCSLAPSRTEASIRPACDYYSKIFDARRATLVSTNYSMYLSHYEHAQGFGTFDALVLDEAHDADKELEAFLTL
jgi:Rad3-related DNA helicase